MGFLVYDKIKNSLGSVSTSTGQTPSQREINERSTTIERNVQTAVDVSGPQLGLKEDFFFDEVKITDTIAGNYEPIFTKGLNQQRPEILALINYLPIYEGDSDTLSAAGKFLDLQLSLNTFKNKNILDLLEILKSNENTKNIVEELENKGEKELKNIENEISFLRSILFNLEQAKEALKIKGNEEKIKNEILRIKNQNIRSLKNILIDDFGFTENSYNESLDTKILLTLISDLVQSITSHSPLLFANDLTRRKEDTSSISIVKLSDTTGSRFLVLPHYLSQNGFGLSNINDWTDLFADRLPATGVDKLLFFCSFLSKEFSISAGLSRGSVNNLLSEKFPDAPHDIRAFNAVLGAPGDTVLDDVFGQNSLSNFIRFEDENNNVIMSFENKFIDADGNKFIPGTTRFIDSILKNKEGNINIVPITTFEQQFDRVVNTAETIINNSVLFDGLQDNSLKESLKPKTIFAKFLQSINEIIFSSLQPRELPVIDIKTTKILAFLNEAKTDKEIKKILFKIFLGEGLRRTVSASRRTPSINQPDTSLTRSEEDNTNISLNPVENANVFYSRIISGGISQENFADLIFRELQITSNSNSIDTALSELIKELAIKLKNKYGDNSTIPNGNPVGFINTNDLTIFGQGFFAEVDSVFRKMNDFLEYLDTNAIAISSLDTNSILVQDLLASYTNPSLPGATKANSISLIYIAWMVFEMYLSFINEYFNISFTVKNTDNVPNIFTTYSPTQVATSLNSVRIKLGLSTQRSQFITIHGTNENLEIFNNIETKLKKEIDIIRDITSIFVGINSRIKTSVLNLSEFFDENRENKRKFIEIQSKIDGAEKLSSLSEAQINVATVAFENMKIARNNPDSVFIDDSYVPEHTKSALFGTLKDPKFRKENGFNLKLISVGLPSGFADALKKRIDTFVIGAKLTSFSAEANKESDIININVYKQDLLFEDLIFKPISFIFEMSRFIFLDSFSQILNNNISNNNILNLTKTKNLLLFRNNIINETLKDIKNKEKYSFLSEKEIIEMVQNHINSFILNLYTKSITSINLSEKEFLINSLILEETIDINILEIFKEMLLTHISNIAQRKISFDELKSLNPQIKRAVEAIEQNKIINTTINTIETKFNDLNKSANVQITESIKNFLNIFSYRSFLFGVGSAHNKIVSPKMFERILTLAVDPDEFEIDIDKTLSTNSGKTMWNQDYVRENIVEIDNGNGNIVYKLKPKKAEGNLPDLTRFFVVVEQIPVDLQQDGFVKTKTEALTPKQRKENEERQRTILEEAKNNGIRPSTTSENVGADIGASSKTGPSVGINTTSHGSDSSNGDTLSLADL